jgi:hypothetical protein
MPFVPNPRWYRRSRQIVACVFAFVAFVSQSIAQSTKPATTTAPTTQPLIDREEAHLKQVTDRLQKNPALQKNPYVRLELAVARRFLDRLATNKGKSDHSLEWASLQTDEIRTVLRHTEQTIDQVEAGKLPPEGLGPVPVPTGGPVKIDNGVFVTSTIIPGIDEEPKDRPFYFGGYGHFQQVIDDLPKFPELGVTLIQDSRSGPDQGLKQDRTLMPAGNAILDSTKLAAKENVKVDLLTSPHYFPAWAVNEAPDMQNGTAFNNIDHPKQHNVIETWLKLVGTMLSKEPAIMSYCLSNEAVYSSSGRDQYSAPAWHAFLKDRHKTIENLNKLYEKKYKTFDEVPADGWADNDIGRRHAYDWASFNDLHFAQWHQWMGDVLKKQDPRVLTHAKIMIFFALDYDKGGWGIDPERFADATDIAGCDAYAQIGSGVGPLDETAPDDYAYHWQVQELCYDLLHSFRNQPVFNSENHPMPNATGAYRWPSKQMRAVMWQGGLHHQGATTTWAWEEATADALLHTVYFRPAQVWAQGRAMMDLNRLSSEVTAINRAAPTVAILYSPASRFWEKDYATTVRTVYTALNFMGENVTFVSERQLAERKIPKVRAIVVPHATHVTEAATAVLRKFKGDLGRMNDQGARLILVGDNCLKFDEYHRACASGSALAAESVSNGFLNLALIGVLKEQATADALRLQLPRKSVPLDLKNGKGEASWGVEYRAIEHDGALLVPLINMLKQPQTVSVTADHIEDEAIDLLTHEIVSLKNLELQPMSPMLLKISRR